MSYTYCRNCKALGADNLHFIEGLLAMGLPAKCRKCGHEYTAITTEDASQIVREGEQLNEDGLVQSPDNAVTGEIRDEC